MRCTTYSTAIKLMGWRAHAAVTNIAVACRVLTAARRKDLSGAAWRPWGQAFVDDLSVMHPDLPRRLQRIDLMRYGHAMAMPVPGLRSHPALAALAAPPAPGSGRVHFALADLSGYSVFEEAFSHGHRAGSAVAAALRGGPAPRR